MNNPAKHPASQGGKAEGLLKIRALEGVNVPAFAVLPADATPQECDTLILQFMTEHPEITTAAVRSSALKEDGSEASFAGAFETLLNIPMRKQDIAVAVATIQRHGEKKLSEVFNTAAEKSMGVVIQRMIESPDFAGVCLSQGYGTEDNAYLLLNFRQGLGDALVGGADSGKQLRILRSGTLSSETLRRYPFLPELITSIKKIEKHFDDRPMDMEFAVKDGTVYMLQARPFITKNPATVQDRLGTEKAVQAVSRQIADIPLNDLLCDMMDINPRELLGHPAQPVNIALFRQMFADKVVEQAREDIGYAPLHEGLLREVHGKPYISLRASAYSLRPNGISDSTYAKIVGTYRDFLQEFPDRQDSVEFDVFLTGAAQLPPFFHKHGEMLNDAEKAEISDAFALLDRRLLSEIKQYCHDYSDTLVQYQQKIRKLTTASTEQEALALLQEGTALFVKTARLAFYKKAACDDLYGAEKTTAFLVCMGTPSEQLQKDLLEYARHHLDIETLSERYGHIRAGQMDIFAAVYRDDLSKNLDLPRYQTMEETAISTAENEMGEKLKNLQTAMDRLPPSEKPDIEDLRLLLAAREQIKHEFMRVYDILAGKIKGTSAPQALHDDFILLPDILSQGSDLNCIEISTKQGTYFGKNRIEAFPIVITDENLHRLTRKDIEGKILIMDHADPGYDFLLLLHPAGIITKVGGPASHIAIRVNEYGIPACIGCGIDPILIDPAQPYVLDCAGKRHHAGQTAAESHNQKRKPENAPPAP
jgi:hypothetical protein